MKRKKLEKMLEKFKSEVISELKPEIGDLIVRLLTGTDLERNYFWPERFGNMRPTKIQEGIDEKIEKYVDKLIYNSEEIITIKEIMTELEPLLKALDGEEFIDKIIDRINRKQLGRK